MFFPIREQWVHSSAALRWSEALFFFFTVLPPVYYRLRVGKIPLSCDQRPLYCVSPGLIAHIYFPKGGPSLQYPQNSWVMMWQELKRHCGLPTASSEEFSDLMETSHGKTQSKGKEQCIEGTCNNTLQLLSPAMSSIWKWRVNWELWGFESKQKLYQLFPVTVWPP